MGDSIRDLGEFLPQNLCQKFIDQLKLKLQKTSLSDSDIKKAASLYVLQRRKKEKS